MGPPVRFSVTRSLARQVAPGSDDPLPPTAGNQPDRVEDASTTRSASRRVGERRGPEPLRAGRKNESRLNRTGGSSSRPPAREARGAAAVRWEQRTVSKGAFNETTHERGVHAQRLGVRGAEKTQLQSGAGGCYP